MHPNVVTLPVLEDNYTYVVIGPDQRAVVVDPGDGDRVWAYLEEAGCELEAILATHHQFDHVMGVEALRARRPVDVYAFSTDMGRVPQASRAVEDGETFDLAGLRFEVRHVPGHTLGHVAYRCGDALFVGDALFLGGCGRLFEGTAEQSYHSLYEKVLTLPDETRLFVGHEYTVRTRSFCLSVDAGNARLRQALDEARALRDRGEPTVPGLLETERATNVFLRCAEPAVVQAVRERAPDTSEDPVAVFTQLRAMMDVY